MNYKVLDIDLPDKTFQHRHYCLSFNNAYLRHKDFLLEKGIGKDWVEVFHNGKKLNIDEKDLHKAGRHDLIYSEDVNNDTSFDENIEQDIFLFYDRYGLNYAHFFFDLFGKILYFEQLLKTNPSLVLGIPEDFYSEKGNSTFIKEWLTIYNKDLNIVVLKKNKRYKIKNLIFPNIHYSFPEPFGDGPILDKIIEVTKNIPVLDTIALGCYISRQDTIKRGWYYKRELLNELELIDKIKSNLGYDIIELMDLSMYEKIQIFKSYKNIIQQSSASSIGIIFSTKKNNNIIISHPKMETWLNSKLTNFSDKSGAPLYTLNGGGECEGVIENGYEDQNNLPWKLHDIDGIIKVLNNLEFY